MAQAATVDSRSRRLAAISRRLEKHADLVVERDDLIVELHGDGLSLRAIAALAGITHVRVLRVLRRMGAA